MALQIVTLEKVASVFGVHPRTILRALKEDRNIYWTEDINGESHSIEDIAAMYGMHHAQLVAVIEGRDELLTAPEAIEKLGIPPRTFQYQLKHMNRDAKWGRVQCGGVVRYLNSRIVSAHIDSLDEDMDEYFATIKDQTL